MTQMSNFRLLPMDVSPVILVTLLLFIINQVRVAHSIKCRQCEKRFGTCDDGECTGNSCILVKVSSSNEPDSKVTKKTCSLEQKNRPECFLTHPDGIESMLCYCLYDYCNSEAELAKMSGITQMKQSNDNDADDEMASSASAVTATSHLVIGGDRSKRTNLSSSQTFGISTNYLVMLIFMCLFITGSFSLLLFNTVCVHLC